MAMVAIGLMREQGGRETGKLLKCGVSVTAICAFALAAPAVAQTGAASGQGTAGTATPTSQPQDGPSTEPTFDAPQGQSAATQAADEPVEGEVVVTGIRQSLANAQSIKRNADTVVDAITAQDIGALPDRSVTEALQRVPGVSINRFAGSNDPDHFSVEGSGVVVRGLNFVRSEFNGRDTFSTGVGGQAINFADVPSELLGSVEIYKNATADLIEGGLAGTVNLNTRKPFDNRGFHIGGAVEANYGDFRKEWTPTASLLVSNTWDTGAGRFGILANISYSRLKSRADGLQVTNIQTRDGSVVQGANNGGSVCRNPLPSNSDAFTLPPPGSACGTAGTPGADGLADLLPTAYAPIGGQFRSQDFDRKRDGQAFAFQWESNDQRTLFTAQFLRTHSTNSWGEHTFESAPDLSEYNTYPFGCRNNTNGPGGTTRAECPVGSFQNFSYDEDGLFESGYITLPNGGWRGPGPAGAAAGANGTATGFVPAGGIAQSLSRRQVFDENEVSDYGFNLKVNPDDRWSINLDADYTRAKHDVTDFSVFGSTFADQELDLTGDLPVVIPRKPVSLSNPGVAPSPGLAGLTETQYFQSPDVQFWRAAMDHLEDSDGHEWQFKGDASYKFDDGSFLNRIKFGARYAERQQTVRYTAYNWGVLSEVWAGTSPVSISQFGSDRAEFYGFPNFFRGDTPGPVGGFYYNGDLIDDYAGSADFFKQINNVWQTQNGGSAGWRPAGERAGVVAGTPYLPADIQDVRQEDSNAYLMLNFGSEDPVFGDVRLQGNIGVRYVHTLVTSGGQIGAPSTTQTGTNLPFEERCRVVVGQPAPGGVCRLGPEGYAALQRFSTGETIPDVAKNSYNYWLPSLNLKFGLTNDLVLRLAGSRVLTRPDLANIRNFLTVGFESTSGQLTATAGNPFLKPALAWQFDASLEWYFARVGSLTLNGFYKSIDNFFYQAVTTRAVTGGGTTQDVLVRGPANYDESGKIKGFEVAYQQTYDFLPGLLSGFGSNINYSFIDSTGLPNSFLNGGNLSGNSTITPGNLPLEGLSKHNVNATVFYEKGPISLRAAYNWRSRFLLTPADVIFPFTSIFNEETGQLDASLFVNVNKYVKVGVQGVNLLNEVTKTLQAYTGDPDRLAPRSYFVNDRRFSFILRGNF